MTKRTGLQIESDIFGYLKSTPLVMGDGTVQGAGGSLYRGGLRPLDSKAEDIIVRFTTCDASQFQQGVVTVITYVPDINPYGNGVFVTDGKRCEELEILSQKAFEVMHRMRTDYHFSLRDAIHTTPDEAIHQSMVVMHLGFSYYGHISSNSNT